MHTTRKHLLALFLAVTFLAASIFGALFAYQEKCLLQAELADVQRRNIRPPAESTAQLNVQTDSTDIQSTESRQENEQLLADLLTEEEFTRFLVHSQQCFKTKEALEEVFMGGGGGTFEVRTPQDVERYWQAFELDKEFAEKSYTLLVSIVSKLDLSQLTKEEQEKLDKYMALREEWNKILYDMDVPIEEKVQVGSQLRDLDYKERMPEFIRKLAEDSFGEKINKYNTRYKQFRSTFSMPQLKGGFYLNYNDHPYKIIVPDDFTFPDDTTLDDE